MTRTRENYLKQFLLTMWLSVAAKDDFLKFWDYCPTIMVETLQTIAQTSNFLLCLSVNELLLMTTHGQVMCPQSSETIFLLFLGDVLKQFYFPVLVTIGIVGNILSFLVRTAQLYFVLGRVGLCLKFYILLRNVIDIIVHIVKLHFMWVNLWISEAYLGILKKSNVSSYLSSW